MFVLFEDAGKYLGGRVISEAEASAQVELDSGKRVKAKSAHIVLRFDKPAPAELIAQAGKVLGDIPDLTIELITHRYTPGSKAVLQTWYPGSSLDLGMANRTEKRTKFGSVKYVYDADTMRALRAFFADEIAARLPEARILYWT